MTISTPAPVNPSLVRAHVSWFGTFRSEWTKFWSLRSTYIIIAVAAVVMIGFSFLFAIAIREGLREAGGFVQVPGLGRAVAEVIAWISLEGIMFAQLAIGVLGVLLVSGEYSTGMIRATMTAVPKRVPVLVMKAAVLVVATLLTMIPISIVAFLAAQGQYSEFGLDAKLTDPGVGRIILGVALYLCAIGMIGSAFGWLFRSAAGAIFALVTLLLILPILLSLVQLDWVQTLADYMPGAAGGSVYAPTSGFDMLPTDMNMATSKFGPWEGYGIMLAWTVGGLILAGWLLRRRDA